MGVVKEESEERRAAGGRKRRRRRGKEEKDEEAIYVAMVSTPLSLSLPLWLFPDWTQGATSMAARLPVCSPARSLARSLARLLGPASLDYLKNRIPPARNCVSRLPCLYTNTRVGEQCWMRCMCTTGPRLTGPAFPPA